MTAPAVVPWIQFSEPVVAENEPNGVDDVANRPLKFIIEQSGFAVDGLIPGFMGRYVDDGSPEGVVEAPVGHAYVDQLNEALYIKMTTSGNTGWRDVSGGNLSGDDSPEGVISGTVGRFYEQRNSDAADHPAWVKFSGTGNTGWRKLAGYVLSNGAIVVGDGNTVHDDASTAIVIGTDLAIPENAQGSIYIGDGVVIDASASDGQVVIGANASGGANANSVVIGAESSADGGSGVVIKGTNTVAGSAGSVAINGTISGTNSGNNVVIGGQNVAGGKDVVIGFGAVAGATNGATVCIGAEANVSSGASGSIAIGQGTDIFAQEAIAIGFGAVVDTGHDDSIVIGRGTTIQANEMVIGGHFGQITQVRIGDNTENPPPALTFRVSNASGTDTAGANWTFISSRATGNAASGSFIFQVGDAGSTGATLQTAATKFSIAPTFVKSHTLFVVGAGAPSVNNAGITIDGGAADTEYLTFRSSDIAHGITTQTETDTFGSFRKAANDDGGLRMTGHTEVTMAIQVRGQQTTEDTTKGTSSVAPIVIDGLTKSGTTVATPGANSNIIVFRNGVTTRFILDADGDSHQDVGTAWTNFDTHDDIALLNTLSAHVTRGDDPLRASFSRWLAGSRAELERLKLVTFNEDGHHFVNMSRLAMLHTGAIRQLGEKLERIETMMARLLPAEA